MDDMELKEDQVEPSAEAPEVPAVDTVDAVLPEPEAVEPVEADEVPAEALEAPAEDAPAEAIADEVVAEPVAEPEPEPDAAAAPEPEPAAIPAPVFSFEPEPPHTSRVGTFFKVAFLVLFLVVSLAAIVGDYVALAYVPRGVALLGTDVSNFTDSQLRAAIDRNVASPAMQPLTVLGDTTSWQLDPRGIVTVDVDAMVQQAYAPAHKTNIATRLWSRISGAPLRAEVKPVYSVDSSTLQRWVADTAATVNRAPVDATRTVVKYKIKITPETPGASVDQTRAIDVLTAALTAEESLAASSRTTSLPIDFVAPKVTKAKFKRAIVVSLSRCMVYLYNGEDLVKKYRCAPGQPAYPSPRGDFVINRKAANAPWINPGSAWAASMPRSIPGGPGNPMGDRKIGINYPGVYLHGIPPSEYSSIGTHASHGCMRMMPASIHDLYPRVRVGDPVFIRN